MSLFDDIKIGLGQTIECEKGNLKATATTLTLEPFCDNIYHIRDITEEAITQQTKHPAPFGEGCLLCIRLPGSSDYRVYLCPDAGHI